MTFVLSFQLHGLISLENLDKITSYDVEVHLVNMTDCARDFDRLHNLIWEIDENTKVDSICEFEILKVA